MLSSFSLHKKDNFVHSKKGKLSHSLFMLYVPRRSNVLLRKSTGQSPASIQPQDLPPPRPRGVRLVPHSGRALGILQQELRPRGGGRHRLRQAAGTEARNIQYNIPEGRVWGLEQKPSRLKLAFDADTEFGVIGNARRPMRKIFKYKDDWVCSFDGLIYLQMWTHLFLKGVDWKGQPACKFHLLFRKRGEREGHDWPAWFVWRGLGKPHLERTLLVSWHAWYCKISVKLCLQGETARQGYTDGGDMFLFPR